MVLDVMRARGDALNPLLASTAKLRTGVLRALCAGARRVKIRARARHLLPPAAGGSARDGARRDRARATARCSKSRRRDGLRGFGEAMPLPGFGLETLRGEPARLAAIARACSAATCARLDERWRASGRRRRVRPPRVPPPTARCTTSQRAKRGVSVASLLAGGRAVERACGRMRSSPKVNPARRRSPRGASPPRLRHAEAQGRHRSRARRAAHRRGARSVAAPDAHPTRRERRLRATARRMRRSRASRASSRSSSSNRSRRTTRGAGRDCARRRPCRSQPTNRCATKRRRGRCSTPAPSIGWC